MPEELTTEYNMENWREATKDWTFTQYSVGGYGEMPGTMHIGYASQSEKPYERSDFERDLRKVSQRRMSKTRVDRLRMRFPQPPATDDPATYEFEN